MKKLLTVLKYVCMLLAYAFIIHKVLTYKNYVELLDGVASFSFDSLLYLLIILLLLPLNIYLESSKWRLLVEPICKLTVLDSIKSVLVGMVGAMATPNKLGDFPLRTVYMPDNTRAAGVTVGFVGSWLQTIVIAVVGLTSVLILIRYEHFEMANSVVYVNAVIIILLVLLLLFFFLPILSKRMLSMVTALSYVKNIFSALSAIKPRRLIVLFLLTGLRYFVFSLQFYLTLLAFGVELNVCQAVLSISAMYLLITITPSIVVSDLVVRTSYSLMIIGLFSTNILAISLSSTFVWIVNCLLPMIFGSVLAFFNTVKS